MIAVAVAAFAAYCGLLVKKHTELRRVAAGHRLTAAAHLAREQASDKKVKSEVSDISFRVRRYARVAPLADMLSVEHAKLDETMRNLLRLEFGSYRQFKEELSKQSAKRQYYESLAAKYERAARRPWLPVPPDPPEPA